MVQLRGVVDFFVFDPRDAKTMYAHATGLWRSTDGGEKWTLVYPSPAAVKGVKMNSDHSDEQILADPDPLGMIAALAVDQLTRMFSTRPRNQGERALFVSRDDGKSWQKQARLPDVPRHLWVDLHSAADGRTLFLASAHSIAVANASGVRSLPLPAAVSDIHWALVRARSRRFMPLSEHGVFISKDGGEKWSNSRLPGRGRESARDRDQPAASGDGICFLRSSGARWQSLAGRGQDHKLRS